MDAIEARIPARGMGSGQSWHRGRGDMQAEATPSRGHVSATNLRARDISTVWIPIIFAPSCGARSTSQDKPGFMDTSRWAEPLQELVGLTGAMLLVTKLGEPPGSIAVYPNRDWTGMVTPDVIARCRLLTWLCPYVCITSIQTAARRSSTMWHVGTTRLRLTIPLLP